MLKDILLIQNCFTIHTVLNYKSYYFYLYVINNISIINYQSKIYLFYFFIFYLLQITEKSFLMCLYVYFYLFDFFCVCVLFYFLLLFLIKGLEVKQYIYKQNFKYFSLQQKQQIMNSLLQLNTCSLYNIFSTNI